MGTLPRGMEIVSEGRMRFGQQGEDAKNINIERGGVAATEES